jgi:hypothetical protein
LCVRIRHVCSIYVFPVWKFLCVITEQLSEYSIYIIKKYSAECGTRRFIAVLTKACHPSLSWAKWKQCYYPILIQRVKGRGKGHPMTCPAGTEERRKYSSKQFATSMLEGSGWSVPRPTALPSRSFQNSFAESCVDLGAGLDGCGKSRPHRDSIPDRPGPNQSLYRLRYPF